MNGLKAPASAAIATRFHAGDSSFTLAFDEPSV
jgi:hypothetical protein